MSLCPFTVSFPLSSSSRLSVCLSIHPTTFFWYLFINFKLKNAAILFILRSTNHVKKYHFNLSKFLLLLLFSSFSRMGFDFQLCGIYGSGRTTSTFQLQTNLSSYSSLMLLIRFNFPIKSVCC